MNIEFELNEDQPVIISFFDVAGKLILSKTQSLSAGDQLLQFDVAAYPAGFYFAEIKTNTEKQTLKFVKQ